MRRTLLLASLIAPVALAAQNFAFPFENATWVQYFEVMVTPPPIPQFEWTTTANFCVDGTDTLIAGTDYSQLRHCGADYVGGIREENGAVYFFPADSTQEYLLYDFGAAVDDTLHGVYVNEELGCGGSTGWMGARLVDVRVVTSAPNPNYGGRIGLQVQAIDPSIGVDSEWIEGMGCVHGLFNFNPINVSQYWFGLDCFSHNDTTFWDGWYTETPGICVPQFMDVKEQHVTVARAYPNPSTGWVRLEGMGGNLVVRDVVGRSLQVPLTRVATGVIDLDLSALPVGLYTVHDSERRAVRLSRE